MVIKPTEDRILELLKKNQQATCLELASILGMTKANVLYHLQKMVQQKLVEAASRKHSEGRGRPVKLYRLRREALENDYPALCDLILESLLAGGPPQQTSEQKMAVLGEQMAKRVGAMGSMIQRLNQLVHFLNRHGYQANWEAHQHGPVIFFRNCPYAALQQKFPCLCVMDGEMLRRTLLLWMRPDRTGDNPARKQPFLCRFSVESGTPEKLTG